MLLGKPLLSCHAAQRQEPAWHLAIRGLAEPILSVKQREKKNLSKIWYQTEVTCLHNLCDALWLLSYIFNHIYSAKNIFIFYYSSLSGPFYKLSGVKHHYAILRGVTFLTGCPLNPFPLRPGSGRAHS